MPHIVEKDYVLGWILAGINAHEELSESWVFKGGTCLKKCYFETYRFSEDLDFTLRNEDHLDEEFLRRVFEEVVSWATDQSGLNIPADQLEFDIYDNPRGRPNCQGKVAYRGPVSPTSGGWPKIKLDLTADERLVLPSVRREVFHHYSDRPEGGIWANCYAYEEAFGEKLRALGERTRPRDLYDVVNLFRHTDSRPTATVLWDVLRQKCEYKAIPVPTFQSLIPNRQALEGMWSDMLSHQLPSFRRSLTSGMRCPRSLPGLRVALQFRSARSSSTAPAKSPSARACCRWAFRSPPVRLWKSSASPRRIIYVSISGMMAACAV